MNTRKRATYISKIHGSKLAQSADNLASDFIGDIELRQGHVRRAEQGILWWRHLDSIERLPKVTFLSVK